MPGNPKRVNYDKSSYGLSVHSDNNLATCAEFFQEAVRRGYRSVILMTHDITLDIDLNSITASNNFANSREQILFATEACMDYEILEVYEKHYTELHKHMPHFVDDLVVRKVYRF